MERLKSLLNDRIFLTILVVILTVGIIKAILALIYVKDEPKFIPEEVREDIRGTIKESVAEPLQRVAPAVGQALVGAAFVDQSKQPTKSNTGSTTDDTTNWKTYKNEEYGFELRYPEKWVGLENSNVITFKSGEEQPEIGIYLYKTSSSIDDFWAKESENIQENFEKEKVLEIGNLVVHKFLEKEGMGEIHYVFIKDGVGFDLMTISLAENEITKIIETIK